MNPFKRKNGQSVISQSVVLDTSGLIDGRIVQIAKAGFVPQNIVVAQFVIAELQFLADHGDSHKRERARYGMDVIRELQDIKRVDVEIARQKFENIREVDDKLVALAKQLGAMLYTTDFNLNKVAQIEGVAVLNVNELAQALRPNLLPGERVVIKLTQVGQDKTQGVGYLSDGTMVVVEQASRLVGQQVQAVCTRILQTQAGKMMFATLANGNGGVSAHNAGQHGHRPQTGGGQSGQGQQRQDAPKHEQPRQPQQQRAQQAKKPTQQQQEQRAERPARPGAGTKASAQSSDKPQQARRSRSRAAGTPNEQQSKKQEQQPAQQGQQKSASQPRSRSSRRRVSPEDSLIAALNEQK